jgi:hypothetical protein
LASNGLNVVISRKIELFITTDVRTSDPTRWWNFGFYSSMYFLRQLPASHQDITRNIAKVQNHTTWHYF